MAVMEQNRFYGCHGAGSFLVSRNGGVRSRGRMFGRRCVRRTRRGFLRGSRAGWWRCRSWPCSGRARPGWWSGAYGGRKIVVMRSSSRPGSWRPVRAFAWWGRALSGTTAILPPRFRVGAGPVRGSSARCPGSARSGTARLFCWSGEGVGEGLGRPLPVHGRPGALPFRGLHAAGPGLVLQAAWPGWSRVPASGRGRVPPRPGSPHARPGPGASWWPASRPAIPAPSSPSARPSLR